MRAGFWYRRQCADTEHHCATGYVDSSDHASPGAARRQAARGSGGESEGRRRRGGKQHRRPAAVHRLLRRRRMPRPQLARSPGSLCLQLQKVAAEWRQPLSVSRTSRQPPVHRSSSCRAQPVSLPPRSPAPTATTTAADVPAPEVAQAAAAAAAADAAASAAEAAPAADGEVSQTPAAACPALSVTGAVSQLQQAGQRLLPAGGADAEAAHTPKLPVRAPSRSGGGVVRYCLANTSVVLLVHTVHAVRVSLTEAAGKPSKLPTMASTLLCFGCCMMFLCAPSYRLPAQHRP